MICRIHDWVMNLRSRVIGGGDGQEDEEEVLIEQENDEEEEVTEKKGVAGDERNIAVLLFLYVLQVDIWPILSREILTYFCLRASLLAWPPPYRSYSPTKMFVPLTFRYFSGILAYQMCR